MPSDLYGEVTAAARFLRAAVPAGIACGQMSTEGTGGNAAAMLVIAMQVSAVVVTRRWWRRTFLR